MQSTPCIDVISGTLFSRCLHRRNEIEFYLFKSRAVGASSWNIHFVNFIWHSILSMVKYIFYLFKYMYVRNIHGKLTNCIFQREYTFRQFSMDFYAVIIHIVFVDSFCPNKFLNDIVTAIPAALSLKVDTDAMMYTPEYRFHLYIDFWYHRQRRQFYITSCYTSNGHVLYKDITSLVLCSSVKHNIHTCINE